MKRESVAEYAEAIRRRYLASTKGEKQQLLTEFCRTTGYHRKAAIRLLHRPAQEANRNRGTPRTRGRPQQYNALVIGALKTCWEAANRISGKRLAPFLPQLVDRLEACRELRVDATTRAALVQLSASTIDRRLQGERRTFPKAAARRNGNTAEFRRQIPVRIAGSWRNAPLGTLQADLVEHCGEHADGSFLYTLTVVEVGTVWTVCRPVRSKAMGRVRAAFQRIRQGLPMPVVSLHTDNGSEFLNAQLMAYCRQQQLELTRGRPYRKNDQAHVEQRNWVAVREVVGYARFSSAAAYTTMEQLYAAHALYMNFFQPVRKVTKVERSDGKLTKHYDVAKTPYQRLLATEQLSTEATQELARLYAHLNPVTLRAELAVLSRRLWAARDLPKTARAVAETG